MLIDYIKENYQEGEPIFLDELPGNSKNYICQEIKALVDKGILERLYNGVYFLSYTTILGTKGQVSIDRYVSKKYIDSNDEIIGYKTGLGILNEYGFTTQNPSVIEVCSNQASSKQRKFDIGGRKIIVYKPLAKVTKENYKSLQFLDMMNVVDKYSELSFDELKEKIQEYVKENRIDFSQVKEYLPLYPDRVYRNLYLGGLMNELV